MVRHRAHRARVVQLAGNEVLGDARKAVSSFASAKTLLAPFADQTKLWWVCMPEPLMPKIGLGMNVRAGCVSGRSP